MGFFGEVRHAAGIGDDNYCQGKVLFDETGLGGAAHGIAQGAKEILPIAVTAGIIVYGASLLSDALGGKKKK